MGRRVKLYHGRRTDHGCAVVVEEGDECRGLDPRFDLRRHTLSGFEWGFSGSGPAQLALALAADALDDDNLAQEVHLALKFRLVGRLPDDEWTLSEDRIRAIVAEIVAARGRVR